MRKIPSFTLFALFVLVLAGGLAADIAQPASVGAPVEAPLVLAPVSAGCAAAEAAVAVPGEAEALLPPIGFPTPCGNNVCGAGQYCCNASCGTCANRGDYCLDVICNPTS